MTARKLAKACAIAAGSLLLLAGVVAAADEKILVPLFQYSSVSPRQPTAAQQQQKLDLELTDESLDKLADLIIDRMIQRGLFGGEIKAASLQAGFEPDLRASCKGCHSGASSKKGFQIFDDEGKLQPLTRLQRWELWDRVQRTDEGQMPPKPKPPLKAQTVGKLRDWARQADVAMPKAAP
jgi:hypothetical protein